MQKSRELGLACLKGLVDVFGPVLVGLFYRQLCLFELQELAPKKLRRKRIQRTFPLISISLYRTNGKA